MSTHPTTVFRCFLQLGFVCVLLLLFLESRAQTEFPKEFIMHLQASSGMVSQADAAPELFVGSLQVVPQVTLVQHLLRGGVAAGGFYTDRHLRGLLGPTFSVLLRELKGGYFGSLGNVHLSAEHLWGTGRQHLVGGGLHLDLLNKVVLGLTAHRDYTLHNWWIQSAFAFRVSRVKTPAETFPH